MPRFKTLTIGAERDLSVTPFALRLKTLKWRLRVAVKYDDSPRMDGERWNHGAGNGMARIGRCVFPAISHSVSEAHGTARRGSASSRRELRRRLGDEPPLTAGGRRLPDRREVSTRWLAGTFLTAIVSSALMGIALFSAADGRQQLTIPGEAYASIGIDADASGGAGSHKAGRLFPTTVTAPASRAANRRAFEISTTVREGEQTLVRARPFAHVRIMLAANQTAGIDYPRFDPFSLFASGSSTPDTAREADAIYDAEVESEMRLRTTDFPLNRPARPMTDNMDDESAERQVRHFVRAGEGSAGVLAFAAPPAAASAGPANVLAPGVLEISDSNGPAGVRVVAENVSLARPVHRPAARITDTVVPVRTAAPVGQAFSDALETISLGPGGQDATGQDGAGDIAAALARQAGADNARPDDILRIAVERRHGDATVDARVMRVSLYRAGRHLGSVARTDLGTFVAAAEPPVAPAVTGAFDNGGKGAATTAARNLPRVYDGLYRASLAAGINREMIQKFIRLLAGGVDFKARLKPTDSIEVVFSLDETTGEAGPDSRILFLEATFGNSSRRFYRFRDPKDGKVGYFDPRGRSARRFLLRNPLPGGRFRSGFGMRRHPILGIRRMHTGVDWAASRGTPIIAAGDGTVLQAGWNGGYGKQTIIRHANGYSSSYSHQTRFAKGIKPGARIRQGQVIGYVGSTGLSTGPHLHYELIVNNRKVDPMRIRIPNDKTLKGPSLATFIRARNQIDRLVSSNTEISSLN